MHFNILKRRKIIIIKKNILLFHYAPAKMNKPLKAGTKTLVYNLITTGTKHQSHSV